jgi:hypothetical protein
MASPSARLKGCAAVLGSQCSARRASDAAFDARVHLVAKHLVVCCGASQGADPVGASAQARGRRSLHSLHTIWVRAEIDEPSV